MVRSYLRHGPTELFGVVCSSSSNSLYDGKKAYVPALEDVVVWDVKKGEQVAMWHSTGLRALVTCLARSPTNWDTFAVGYADGSIRLWSAAEQAVLVTFNGHKSAISALAWESDGSRLASGSKDTDIIVWDVVGEVGLFRLRGHRDQVTQLEFIRAHVPLTQVDGSEAINDQDDASANSGNTASPATHLISSSKDTYLKVFSLQTQHCVDTVVGHRAEAWSFAYDRASSVLVSGGGEGEVKCWRVQQDVLVNGPTAVSAELPSESGPSNTSTFKSKSKLKRALTPLAALNLAHTSHTHHVTQVSFHPTLPVLAVLSSDKSIDVFRLRSEDELRKKMARRRRREREKQTAAQKSKGKGKAGIDDGVATVDDENEVDDDDTNKTTDGAAPEWRDRLAVWSVVRTGGKIRSFAFAPETAKTKGDLQIMTALSNNSLEVYHLPPPPSSKAGPALPDKLYTLDLPGHRADVRTLAVSSDDELIASASQGSLKIWNRKTTKCVRTLECGYAICSTFLPGDRHIVVGCKSGELLLYDLSSSSLLETFDAHTGSLWSLSVRPDGRGLVTGSADKDVKFWEFEAREIDIAPEAEAVIEESADRPTTRKVLTLAHTKTLKMTDDVLAVKHSPDGKLLAVSLLDSTVKVFYADTLKFFLSLYGHKLPVLSLDISDDSKLIVTCSADKNIKIWGLDFGDCHRSLFAHDESVMQVAFEKGSHYFWSVGKDRMVKYWDGDKFECIQKLPGHSGEIWALAVSKRANFVVTGSHDKSIRIWEKTDEPLFLEEERERELEELYDSNLNDRGDRDALRVTSANGVDDNNGEAGAGESTEVTKSTTETLMAGERIIEALDVSDADQQATLEHARQVATYADPKQQARVPLPTRNPVFSMYGGCGPHEYVLKIVRQIPAASLHDALLVLPFGKVTQLIEHLNVWAQHAWQITLTSRVLFFLLRTHHSQIVATRALRQTMLSLRGHLRDALKRQKDTIGYNLAALKYISRQHEAARTADFFEQVELADEDQVRQKIEQGLKKRRRAELRS